MKVISLRVKLRLILVCILLGTIPAVIVGIFSYYRASTTIQNKVDEGNMRNLLQIQMSVEQLLLTTDRVMLQFIESPAVKASMTVDMAGNEYEVFHNAENAMNNLPTEGLGANGIYLANMDKGWVISNSGIYRIEEFERKNELEHFLKMPGSSLWVNSLNLKDIGTSESTAGWEGVSIIKKSPIYLSNPSCIVVLRISYSHLSSLIAENKKLGEVMIIGEDGCVIAHSDRSLWGRDLSGDDYIRRLKIQKQNSGNFTVAMENAEYSVNYLKSNYNGWIYISKTSRTIVTKDSKAIGWFTLVICLMLIGMVNIAAFIISNRMYRPIRELYNLVLGIQDFSGNVKKQDELGLIGERVNFLLKDQARLKNQVYNQYEQLKEFFILKLILSEMGKEMVESKIKLYNYPPLPAYIRVFVIRTDTLEGTQYKENDKDLMLFAINNVVGELLEDSIVLKPIVVDEYQITIVGSSGCSDGDLKNHAYSVAERIQEVIQKVLKFTVSIGISSALRDYKDIHRGYLEGVEALKHQIKLGYNSVIFIDDVKGNSCLKPVFPAELENELLDAVKTCDGVKSRELVHQFVERVFMVEVSRYEYQASFIRVLTDLVFLLKESGESYNILIRNGKSVYEQFFSLKTANEIEDWMVKSIIMPMIQCIEKSGNDRYKKIVEDTLKIIHDEYDTELTLEECAARLNYHSSYIRRILKKEAGIVFSDYLSQFRLDMAKKWLLETDMRILDISDRLKYRNPENFIRSFKKVIGITPGQYREANRHV